MKNRAYRRPRVPRQGFRNMTQSTGCIPRIRVMGQKNEVEEQWVSSSPQRPRGRTTRPILGIMRFGVSREPYPMSSVRRPAVRRRRFVCRAPTTENLRPLRTTQGDASDVSSVIESPTCSVGPTTSERGPSASFQLLLKELKVLKGLSLQKALKMASAKLTVPSVKMGGLGGLVNLPLSSIKHISQCIYPISKSLHHKHLYHLRWQ